jgi:hypothetical protein
VGASYCSKVEVGKRCRMDSKGLEGV